MASSTHFIGGYVSGRINIRKFKEQGNPYSAKQPELSNITEPTVIEKQHSINTNLQLTVPVYNSDGTKLLTLDEKMKRDLNQVKPTIMYTPPPNFTPSGNIVPNQALVITVSFYHPFDWLHRQGTKDAKPRWKDSVQFHDGQTLADVRRALVCQYMKRVIGNDSGQNPHKPLEHLKNNNSISSFFYINDIIYIDTQPDKITKEHFVIMKNWAQDSDHIFGKVLSQETQLLDLEVFPGEPHIFQHFEGCEHLIDFNDIKFAQPHSSLDCYPKIIDLQ